MLEQQAVDSNFSNKIFFSDETNFTLDGYVNKQNSHVWGSEKPYVFEERPLHSEKATVWCAVWSEDVIGSYFFKIEDGTTATVN